jgi:peptidoglycan LD-endopeptidase CwlK
MIKQMLQIFPKKTIAVVFLTISFVQQSCGQKADSLAQKAQELFNRPTHCDTTTRLDKLTVYDLTQPLYRLDTIADLPDLSAKIYMVIRQDDDFSWAGLYAPVGEPPTQFEQAGMPTNFVRYVLNPAEKAFLSSLITNPDYLYERYEPLLSKYREDFLRKRDQLLDSLDNKYPNYEIQINSDLRSAKAQTKYLGNGRSMSPLSQHQFGLASDIGAWTFQKKTVKVKGKKRRGRRRTVSKTVTVRRQGTKVFDDLGEISAYAGLTWGGNFLGFIDPNHVQYFENSAQMIQKVPELRYEFEPFRKYYEERITKMTEAGKEQKVEDTKELVEALNTLRKQQPCICNQIQTKPSADLLNQTQKSLANAGYQANTDVLILADLNSQSYWLLSPKGLVLGYRLGRWNN